MAARSPTEPLTPIPAAIKTLPPLLGAPEVVAPVALAVLPAADVAAAVLAAVAELVLAGTSSALRVPH